MADLTTMLAIGLLIIVVAQLAATFLRSVLLIYLQARLDARLMLAKALCQQKDYTRAAAANGDYSYIVGDTSVPGGAISPSE